MSYTTSDAKIKLMRKVERVVGYVPDGMGDILSILMGDDVYPEFAEYMRKYAESPDDPDDMPDDLIKEPKEYWCMIHRGCNC